MVTNLFKHSQQFLEKQQSSILSAAGIITAAVFLSAVLGLVRNRLLVSYFYQDASSLDAYFVAFRLPDLVFQLLVIGALSAAFIPVFSKYQKQDPAEAVAIASSMINLILIVFVVLSIFIFIFAEPLNQMLTGQGFTPEQLNLASKFTRIMLLAQFFFAVSNFLTGIIQAHQRFIIPALSPLAYNFGIILGIIFLGPSLGLYGATVGVVIGAFLHLIFQLPLAVKLGFHYQPLLRLNHPGVREITRLMIPRTLALSVNQLEIFVVTKIATSLTTDGMLTIVVLSQQLMGLPVRVFGMPIGQASLPFLSAENNQSDLNTFKKTFLNSLHQIMYLSLPASVVLIVLRIPAVRLAYGAKAFPWPATLLTGKMLAIMSLAIAAHASVQLLTRAFYALHNTRLPFIASLISVTTNIVLSYILVFNFNLGVLGLAVASSAAAYTHALFLILSLAPKLRGFAFDSLILPPIKITIASVFTGIFLWIPMRLLDQFVFDTTKTVNLILLTSIVSLVGAVVYFSFSKLLNIHELNSYIKLFHKLGNWRQVLRTTEESIDQSSTSI